MKSKPSLFQRVSKSALAPSCAFICICTSTPKVLAALWTGTTSTDWNTASNWDTNRVPVKAGFGDSAVINISPANIATISATISATPQDILIGTTDGSSNGRLDHTAGTAATGGGNWMKIGQNGGTGVYNLSNPGSTGGTFTGHATGAGSMTVNGHLRVGGGDSGTGSTGTANVNTSGTLAINSDLHVGTNASSGTLNLDNGTVTISGNGAIGNGASCTGTLRMSGGTVTGNNEFWVGTTDATGTYTMSGGTLNVNSWFVVGRNGGGNGTINMSGGTINKTGGGDFILGADNSTATGAIAFSGGLINVTGGVTHIGKGGTGTLTISGSADFRTSQMIVGVGTGIGTVNFNGGTLKTPKLNGGAGTATAYFDGGTVQATADSLTFVSDLDTAEILDGGAILDTQAFTEIASQPFSGTGPLTKLGSGTLTLTGDSTHTGLTQVSDGKLVVHTRSTLATGDFSVANGKTLGVTRRYAEETLNVSNLTLGTTAGTATLEINLGNYGNPYTGVATLNVPGNLTVNANTTVNITDEYPQVGSFPLIQFGSRSGTGTITLGSLPPGVVAHLDATIDPNAIYLVIDQAKLLEWDDSELTGGVWNTSNFNWNDVLTFSPAIFTTGSPVVFPDSGTVDIENPPNPNVVIDAAGVSPGSVTFNNYLVDYSISGAGGINGANGLLKQGTANVTISTANAYTGVTRLEAGTLSVSSIANAGSPSGIGASPASPNNLVFAGGTLSYTGAGDTSDRGFHIDANSVFDVQGPLTMSGSVTALTGSLTKNGAGDLTLNNPGALVLAANADLVVNEGSLILSGSGTQTNALAGQVFVGASLAATAGLVLDNTSLTTAGGNYLAIARGSGTPGHVSTVTFNNSTVATGNLSLGYDNGVAGYSATSLLTLNNSSYVTGFSKVGESGGATASLVLNGTSTMTTGNTDVAQSNGATGNLTAKGTSVYTSNNRIQVGRDAGAIGTVMIENSASIVTPSYASVGFGGGGNVTVKDSGILSIGNDLSVNESGATPASVTLQDSGTITVGGVTFVGRNATRVGTVTQTGGTYTGTGGEFRIGSAGTGSWLQSGGVTHAGGWVSIARETGSTGVLTVSGTGTFNQSGAGNAMIVGEYGNGTLNLQGTATVNSVGTGGVVVTRAGGIGTVNLDGGTLVAVKVVEDGGISAFNFNGGVLKAATGADATFLTGIDTAMVKVGGAKIDSNGNDIALNQNFTNDTSNGGFTKTGAGTLFVNGNIGILGQAHISAGTIAGTGNFICALFVDGTSNLNPGGATPGVLTANSTTFAATSTMTIDLAATQDTLVTGALVLNGATLALNGTASQPVHVIAEYTSLPGGAAGKFAGGMSPPALPPGYTIDYAYNGGTQIALVQTATPYTTWAAANILAVDALADATPNGNPDDDGLTNLAEFALNGDPMSGASSGKVVSKIANVGGVPSLVLTLPVRTVATFTGGANNEQNSNLVSGLVYTIEASNALATWNIPVSEVTGADKTAIELPLVTGNPVDSGWSFRTFTTGPVSGSPKEFLRAVIKQP